MPQGFIPVNTPQARASATDPAQLPNISFVRKEVRDVMPSWERISDCLSGEDAVKARTTKYLPVPDEESGGTAQDPRYQNYIKRAVFYGVTGRTLLGLVGQVFGRESVIEMPKDLESMVNDAEGTGTGIEQQAKRALEYCLSFGRGGLLADFPTAEGPVTKEQIDNGTMRPIIRLYKPQDIINWRTKKVGAKTLLSLVVLKETVDVDDDGFETTTQTAYRVLRLTDENVYTMQVYVEEDSDGKTKLSEHTAVIEPKKADGSTFDVIPFIIFGPENNDPDVDSAPLDSMASLNIAHYRNSADYEDAVFIAGQPTPVFAGLNQEWVDKVMKGRVFLGSRKGIMLPKDGSAQMLQAQPNMLPKEAMDTKESQMRAIGAKLVEDRSIRRTATEATQDEASETSILSSSTKNVSAAYRSALEWCMDFTPGGRQEFDFELNSDFDLSSMSPQERQQLVAEWQAEAITFSEMRRSLKRGRIAYLDDEDALTEIKENPPASLELEREKMEMQENAANADRELAEKGQQQQQAQQRPAGAAT